MNSGFFAAAGWRRCVFVAAFGGLGGRGVALWALLGRTPHGYVVHDRYHAYNRLQPGQSQLCWAHLARDFQALVDRAGSGKVLGHLGRNVARAVFSVFRRFRARTLARAELQAALRPAQNLLRRALEEARGNPDKKVRRLATRLLKVYDELWTFTAVALVNSHDS